MQNLAIATPAVQAQASTRSIRRPSLPTTAGFDAPAFRTLVGDAEIKAKLIANTEAAVARGVFGAPTCFVGDEMFVGQDRLDFVREAARAA